MKTKKQILCSALVGGAMMISSFANPIMQCGLGITNVCASKAENLFFNDGHIVLSGVIKTAAEGENIVLTVVRNTDSDLPIDYENLAYMAETTAGKKGAWEFEFALKQSGDYRAYIGSAALSENEIIDFSYTNKTGFETAVALLTGAVTVDEAEVIVKENASDLGVDDIKINDYSALLTLAMSEIKKPNADLTPDGTEHILKKSNMIAELNAGRLESMKEYKEIFMTGEEKYEDYITDDMLFEMTSKLSGLGFESFADFDEAVKDASFSIVVKMSTNATVKELLKEYAGELGVSSSSITTGCVTDLKNENPTTFKQIKDFVSGYKESSESGSGGGKGGSPFGIGGGGFIAGDTNIKDVVPEEPEAIYVFDDIAQVDWAVEAITQLSYRGVLNGKANRIFAPNDNITREEFTKIITVGFKLNLVDAECNFDDVGKESWAYPYIRSAYAAGVVNGISDNLFGVGSNITREDLCVMTDRMIKTGGFELKATQADDIKFNDDAEISDYAKESVYRLTKAGIISGDGTNFMPKQYATRAQAAKIVYLALAKTGR